MSHDDLDTIDVIDEEEFVAEESSVSDEPEKVVVSKKPRRAIRRLIEDALEERRLKAVLKGFDDPVHSADLSD